MIQLQEIHKPGTLQEALQLLKQPGTVVMAGGTELIASGRKDFHAVVDLSGLGLDQIREQDGAVVLGAMATLRQLEEAPLVQAIAGGVVVRAAHRSAASVLRNQETLAGMLIADPAGVLAVALAALDARILLVPPSGLAVDDNGIHIIEFLAGRVQLLKGAIVTEVRIPAEARAGRGAIETVARTPRDRPIVSVCAVRVSGESGKSVAIAVGGVAESALRIPSLEKRLAAQSLGEDAAESATHEAVAALRPPADFRGTAEYRREMAGVLVARAVSEIG